jgi:hypothetical protein
MKKAFPTLFFLLAFICFSAFASNLSISEKLKWEDPSQVRIDDTGFYMLAFNESYYPESPFIPSFQKSYFFQSDNADFVSLELKNLIFDSTDVSGFIGPGEMALIGPELAYSSHPVKSRRQSGVHVTFIPLVFEPVSGKVFRLISFEVQIEYQLFEYAPELLKNDYAEQSVLATGNWYKFSVSETGIYKITYNDLVNAGLNPAGINPQHLRLYGNGGGMLPEPNSEFRHDDLVENAIMVVGEEDGVFRQQDYILFYGQSPHEWKYSATSPAFEHLHNIYDDYNYYFLTADRGMGKRIGTQPGSTLPATDIVNTFNDYQVHEQNTVNLIKSGRQWYGEVFDLILTRNFPFNFPNRLPDSEVNVQASVAAQSLQGTSFLFNINGVTVQTPVAPITNQAYAAHARESFMNLNRVFEGNQEVIDVKLTYNKSASPSKGWLNYIRVHARRNLMMVDNQMPFRNLNTVGPNRVSEFRVGNTTSAIKIWDVTDPSNVMLQQTTQQGAEMVFKLSTDLLREFIAFNPNNALSVEFVEKVANQNLHGVNVPDMLIVTHPLFIDEANRLADFHYDYSGLDVLVVPTPQIYNEFSSGKQDLTAIRDFTRMLYERSGNGTDFRYLLLFGDASYDYKDRVSNNTNFVPVWMSQQSLDPIQSYVTDDYFGFLDENEGGNGPNIVDIGIGRLPVGTIEDATAMVDKIIHYTSNTQITMADWRNYICFVADDEDNNLHIRQAETMANGIDSLFNAFNLSKIYLDAYQQVSVPGGERYPQVNADINRRMQQGALIMNYTGHGGVLGWAHERVLELADIRSWTNFDRMPVFITATCEFAYFDDPTRISAGELVLLNPNGGGIALFTTSRPTYASPNFAINQRLFEFVFSRENGEYLRLGDIIRLAKQNSGSDINGRKFLLLGDPALRLAIPDYKVVTTHLNEQEISASADTLKALSMATISGVVKDLSGNVMEDFNGVLTPTVFDKAQKINTLANDGGQVFTFSTQQNIVYKGNASIENGHFSFSFIVPKDIAYAYDTGKISYYATDGFRDAHGYDRSIVIGGFNENAESDNLGPEIELFINDKNFKAGGITDENPVLLAFINDKSGINTSGIGIGHDIIAVLNEETDKVYVLNDFYQSDLDTYQSGTVRYPFFNLPDGRHHLRLKVWDIYNNPAEGSIEFVVASSGKLALQEVLNYPNPFRDRTHFVVEHNQAGVNVEFEIYIYSLDGRLRKVLREKMRPGGYRSEPLEWDGRGDDGQFLEAGAYVYRVVMNIPGTGVTEKGNKLVIIR